MVITTSNALCVTLAYCHLASFWEGKAKVPLVKDYNDGIRASNNLQRILMVLSISWNLATCFYGWQMLMG